MRYEKCPKTGGSNRVRHVPHSADKSEKEPPNKVKPIEYFGPRLGPCSVHKMQIRCAGAKITKEHDKVTKRSHPRTAPPGYPLPPSRTRLPPNGVTKT